MAKSRIAAAQRGTSLAAAMGGPPRKPKTRGAKRKDRRPPRAAGTLTGPFLSPGELSAAERLRLIDGIETVLDGVYTHLPLKRARYGFDPIQRLRILRTQIEELTDDGFHYELADIVTRLRDAHTRYAGPNTLSGKVAALILHVVPSQRARLRSPFFVSKSIHHAPSCERATARRLFSSAGLGGGIRLSST